MILEVKRINNIIGLMFSMRKPRVPVLLKVSQSKMFRPKGIHTYFVFYSLDVAFVNDDTVIKVARIKPFSKYDFPKDMRITDVVEAPAGRLGVIEGDTIKFKICGET